MKPIMALALAAALTLACALPSAGQTQLVKPSDAASVFQSAPCSGAVGKACQPIVQADTTPFLNQTTASTTRVVVGDLTMRTLFTHVRFLANGSTTGKLVTGTGSNCGTGTADLTETWDLVATEGTSIGNGSGVVLVVPAGLDVCAVNSQNVNLRWGFAFRQMP